MSSQQRRLPKFQLLPKKPKLITSIIAVILVVIGSLSILYAWQLPPFFNHTVRTNDAYITSKTTILSSSIGGFVTDVYVRDFQHVNKGDLIIKLDDRVLEQNLNKAQALLKISQNNLNNFEAIKQSKTQDVEANKLKLYFKQENLTNVKRDYDRLKALFATKSASKQDLDNAKTIYKEALIELEQAKLDLSKAKLALTNYENSFASLNALVEQAKANVNLAKIDLANSIIKAPVDGVLGMISAKVGQYVRQDENITHLIPEEKWVVANIKETKINKIKVGKKAKLYVDALDETLTGEIAVISPATGSEYSVIKVNNATGNFIKIVQRVPVKILIDPAQQGLDKLKSGMSVVVDVDTRD